MRMRASREDEEKMRRYAQMEKGAGGGGGEG